MPYLLSLPTSPHLSDIKSPATDDIDGDTSSVYSQLTSISQRRQLQRRKTFETDDEQDSTDGIELDCGAVLNDVFQSSTADSRTKYLTLHALNVCYQKSLYELNEKLEHVPQERTTYNYPVGKRVSEEDFYPTKYYPDWSEIFQNFCPINDDYDGIYQLELLQNANKAFVRKEECCEKNFILNLTKLVVKEMRDIWLRWLKVELNVNNDRLQETKNVKTRKLTQQKIDTFQNDIQQLNNRTNLEIISKIELLEQVDWQSIATKMRSYSYKHVTSSSLELFWKRRCQYGQENIWTKEDDQYLHTLVELYGWGQWDQIAQDPHFQNKKSPFMLAQRYMTIDNVKHAKRRFTPDEKSQLLKMYNERKQKQDYRFSISS
ncbi:unnamed protein product, partial [Didymodactylos carnosus]